MNAGACLNVQKISAKEHSIDYKMEKHEDQSCIQAAYVAETREANSQNLLDDSKARIGHLSENPASRMDIATNSDSRAKNRHESYEESASFAGKRDEGKMKQVEPSNASHLEHLESMDENDLPTLAGENSNCALFKIQASEFSHGGKMRYQPEGINGPAKVGSCKYQGKGEEKAFSDGDINGRIPKEEDDESYESVESCNSAGLSSRGKKRSNFEQHLIAGNNKQVRRHIQESPGSTSKLKRDSSFMTWISNMTKGSWKPIEHDEARCLVQDLAYPDNHGDGIPDQAFITCCRKEDDESRNNGFRSIFHSIYCPKRGFKEAPVEIELQDKIFGINAIPLSCHWKNPNFKKYEESLYVNEAGVAGETRGSSKTTSSSRANKSDFLENKNSRNLVNHIEKEGTSSFALLDKGKQKVYHIIDSEAPCDGKAIQSFTNRNDPLGSLWITRFSPKGSGLFNKDHYDLGSGKSLASSDNRGKPFPPGDIKTDEPTKIEGGNKTTIGSCDSLDVGRVNGYDDPNFTHNLNQIIPTSRIQSPGSMASLFARRQDAIKQIMTLATPENVGRLTILTCFYCGRKGHLLKDCSEVTDNELEDLMRNVNTQNCMKEVSSLCIRCFEHNHWATACPNAVPHNSRIEESKITVLGKDSQIRTVGSLLDKRFGEAKSVDEIYEASGSGVRDLNKARNMPASDLVGEQILNVPKGIFDAVRLLRLSRTDILKLMNSKVSMMDLDGYFLRLRLGKWEEGLGGTGYYVACITSSAQGPNTPRNSKNSISVTVGGINCSVESQYISNHDFLEEELKAWWCTTARNGGGIPSEEDLRKKLRERKMLGC